MRLELPKNGFVFGEWKYSVKRRSTDNVARRSGNNTLKSLGSLGIGGSQ